MKNFFKKRYALVFFLVTLFLVYPIFQGGYIFLLDWDVTPYISWEDIDLRTNSLGIVLYKAASISLGFGTVQRIVVLSILFFAGMAGFRLARRFGSVWAQYFAGLLCMLNPFLYARLVEQPGIAAGAVFFFWSWVYFLESLEKEFSMKKTVLAGICGGFAVSFFPHSVFFSALVFFCAMLSESVKKISRNAIGDWIKKAVVFFGIVILVNGNWIVSFATGSEVGVGGMRKFTSADVETFETASVGGDSVYATVWTLQGYWGEYQDRFISIRDNFLWFPAFLLLFFLGVFGAYLCLKKRETVAISIVFSAVVAYVLAIGTASSVFASLARFLYEHFPLYIGLREPQKWVAVLVFAYAYFGACGIAGVMRWKGIQRYRGEVGFLCVLLPVAFSFSAIGGMREHLFPHAFPAEWREVKIYMEKEKNRGMTVFFPWQMYEKFDFAGKNIVSPARGFFGNRIITGNNVDFGSLRLYGSDEKMQTIGRYSPKPRGSGTTERVIETGNFCKDMRKWNIDSVILAKTEDWKKYDWLQETCAKKVLENEKLILYQLQ